jgi:hypothetical protein
MVPYEVRFRASLYASYLPCEVVCLTRSNQSVRAQRPLDNVLISLSLKKRFGYVCQASAQCGSSAAERTAHAMYVYRFYDIHAIPS